jgi:transcriptional regulator with XRE-family HTH domain
LTVIKLCSILIYEGYPLKKRVVCTMLAARIKELRNALNKSQTVFGNELGTSRDIISNFEHNKSVPKAAFLELMCRLYNVNPNWLIDGQGENVQPHHRDR